MKKVCVLLSTYNGEKYLRELLESVLSQNKTMAGECIDISIFVRDDGSKDSTVDILKEYANQGKLILADYGKQNMGFAKSFSWLIQNAPAADYYSFCDQDDIWLPDKIANAVTVLEKEDNSIPLLYSTNLIVVDENLKELTRKTHIHMTKNPKHQFEENVLQNSTYGCTVVINDCLQKLYLEVPSEEVRSHDYILAVLASGLGKFVYDENPQILYRQHKNNTIGFYKGSLTNIIRSIKFALKNDFKNSKFQNVKICKQCFYDKFSKPNKQFIDWLVDYKTEKDHKKQLKKFIRKEIDNKFIKSYSLFLINCNKF